MNISIHNYEAYFLDYHEGGLSLDLVKELMEFLSQHPELREEFESFEPITLNDIEGIKYDGKETLKKQASGSNSSNFDEYAVEYVEGTLPPAKQLELSSFISKSPHYQKELELYARTKLTPDLAITFDDKPSLKKGTKRPVMWYYWSAAASVALIVGTYFMLHKNETPNENSVVRNRVVKDSNVIANHITQATDTTTIIKNAVAVPIIPKVGNTRPIVKVQQVKQNKNPLTVPNKISKDSTAIVLNKGKNQNATAPVEKQIPLPVQPMNVPVASSANTPDTSSMSKPVVKTNTSDDSSKEIVTTETFQRKKRGKLLVFLATVTCKGLHRITGQHIELEKHYAADTTTIVAYQLDLGNRKFNFPVKE